MGFTTNERAHPLLIAGMMLTHGRLVPWLIIALFVTAGSGCTKLGFAYAVRGLRLFDDRCLSCVDRYEVEEAVERKLDEHEAKTRRPLLVQSGAHEPWVDRHGRMRSRAPLDSGYFELFGDPRRSETKVVIALRPTARLASEPCSVRLFRNGGALPVHQSQRRSNHELAVAVDVQSLAGVRTDDTFTAYTCGLTMHMGTEGLATLARFATRFRERLAMQQREGQTIAQGPEPSARPTEPPRQGQ